MVNYDLSLPREGFAAPTYSEPVFQHDPGRPAAPTLQNATRYLCGAAYRSRQFRNDAIREVLEDGHRAVAPSYGFDVEPVLRHCLRARRMGLLRGVLLTLLLAGGLCLTTTATVTVVALGWAVTFVAALPELTRRRPNVAAWKIAVGAAVLVVGLPLALPVLVGLVAALSASGAGTGFDDGGGFDRGAGQTGGTDWFDLDFEFLSQVLLIVLAAAVVLVWDRYQVLRVLGDELSPGRPHIAPQVTTPRIANRLAMVSRAQYGNIVLHSGYLPFLGAGRPLRAWSMVLELLPAPLLPGAPPPDDTAPRRISLDSSGLNRHVKRQLAALRGTDLPERERVTGLAIRDLVVATGYRDNRFPLIDRGGPVPYSFASPEAVAAVIAHPQGAARHFLKVTAGTHGQPVRDARGGELLPAEDQEIEVSAFVHVAVEGGLLYLEFVATLLGPIREDLHDIDRLGRPNVNYQGRAIADAARGFGPDLLFAPARLVRDAWDEIALPLRMNRADRDSSDPAYDFGANTSLREMVSLREPETYTGWLDTHKNVKLLERRVTEAVLGFLEQADVDTSEYRARVNVLHNEGTILQNSTVNGPVSGGRNASASMPTGPTQR